MPSMDLCDARAVMAQLPAAFEHFNEVHSYSSLQMLLPREFSCDEQQGALLRIGWGREYEGQDCLEPISPSE